jgi:hypothetical protein
MGQVRPACRSSYYLSSMLLGLARRHVPIPKPVNLAALTTKMLNLAASPAAFACAGEKAQILVTLGESVLWTSWVERP